MHVRKGKVEDAHIIWALMQDAFSEYKTAVLPSIALLEQPEQLKKALIDGEESLLLVNKEGQGVGMVRYTILADYLYFFRMSIKQSEQSKGYAKRLLIALEQEAQRQGLRVLKCKVRENVVRNMYLYTTLGYRQYGEEQITRDGVTVNIVLLEKPI